MYIEDLINRLNSDGNYMFHPLIQLFIHDRAIISSLSTQTLIGSGFTEKQCALAIKLVKKYSNQLQSALQIDVKPFIDNPQFKLPTRTINKTKSINIYKNIDSNKKTILVNFPFDEAIISSIKKFRQISGNATKINWNSEKKSWEFDLREEFVDWIGQNLLSLGFSADDSFLQAYEQIDNIKSQVENYVPMVEIHNNHYIFKNIHKNIPQPSTQDLLPVLFEAKKYGITVWSDEIEEKIQATEINPLVIQFLKLQGSQNFDYPKHSTSIFDIFNVIRDSLPCLVVIPGGSELRHLEICVKILQKMQFLTEDMTVLFRLNGENGKNFNNFVKEQKLNNIISDNLKFVFVSGKVPKPLIDSKIRFSCVLNLGISGVHYTLSNYLKNHQFVINYSLKEQDFVNL